MAITIEDSVITMSAEADAIDAWLYIKKIRWEGGTTAAHRLILRNTSGKELIDMKMPAAVADQYSDGPGYVNGVVVHDLDSGKVKLYVK